MLFGWGMQAVCYNRVVRGGSFYHDLRYDRYACRTRDLPNDCNDIIGFRVVVPGLWRLRILRGGPCRARLYLREAGDRLPVDRHRPACPDR